MITFLLHIINFANSEYYTIVGTDNIMGTTLTLAEGEKFEVISALRDDGSWDGDDLYCYLTYGDETHIKRLNDVPLYGPCTMNFNVVNNVGCHVATYTIENVNSSDDSSASDSKYTVSLNNDGTRLAIGEQQGTNTSTRVYEYDDDNETWEQLGDSVE